MSFLVDRHLRHFIALFEHRSVQGAAAALGLTQPALSKSLRRIEDAVGARLFERTTTGLVVTDAGRRLALHSQVLYDAARQAELDLSSLVGGERGSLRLGAGLAWSLSKVPAVLAEMGRRHPRLSIELIAGVGAGVLPLLVTRAIDVYVGVLHPDLVPPGCLVQRRQDLALRAFVRSGHPLVADPEPARLGDFPWALFLEDAAGGVMVSAALRRHRASAPSFTLSSNSLEALIDTVRQTDHVLPLVEVLTPEARARGLVLVPDLPALAVMPSAVISRRGLETLRPVKNLLDLLIDSKSGLGGSARL